jgi:hypothetical protein
MHHATSERYTRLKNASFILGVFLMTLALSQNMRASIDPRELILSEVVKGTKKITVPPGTYRLVQKDKVFLTLNGVSDTVIDCTGVTFIGLAHTAMLELENCRNVTIKGLAVDYDPLPFTQGVIKSVGADANWEVEIIEGYPVDNVRMNGDVEMRIQAYDPKTGALVNTLRHGDGVAMKKTGERTFRITGGRIRTGRVGDIAVFNTLVYDHKIGHKAGAILTTQCSGWSLRTLPSAAHRSWVS